MRFLCIWLHVCIRSHLFNSTFLTRVNCRNVIKIKYLLWRLGGGVLNSSSSIPGLRTQLRYNSHATTMRALTLLPLFYIHSVLAVPVNDAQIVLGETVAPADIFRGALVSTEENDVDAVVHNIENVLYEDKVETWFETGMEYVKQNGLLCTSFYVSGAPLTQVTQS